MNSEQLILIFAGTVAAVVAFAVTWRMRPDLRRSRILGASLGIATVALTIEVIFVVAFAVALASLPDMSDF